MRKRHGILGIFALMVALAGCGASTASGSPGTVSHSAPATVTATAAPTVSSAAVAACFGPTIAPSQVIQSGDILISPVSVSGLAWPAVALPDGAPTDKPYKVSSVARQAYATDFPNSPVTNPTLNESVGGGYMVAACNTSTSRSYTLQVVSAKMTSFTPYTGQLSSWSWCDGVMDSHHNEAGAGCGGAATPCMCFHARFSSASGGATVTATQNTSMLPAVASDTIGALPFTLKPGQSVPFEIGMDTLPTGTYTFAFGFTFDGVSPIFSASGPTTLIAPVSHKWTGAACQQPAMEAQITPTNPETYYICAQ